MLTPRQKLILSAIVEDYVLSAEPVGSRTLSKHENIKLSAATIRNEMADLEELGYLDQPHTSAGRVPSQKGYRFYVDNLMNQADIDEATVGTLKGLFRQRMDEIERTMQQTSKVLSELTTYTAIVLGPNMYQQKIKHVQLVPLGNGSAVAILVTDSGHVENTQVQMPEDVSTDDVARMVNVLNAKLVGLPLARFRSSLYREIAEEMARTLEHYEDALAIVDDLMKVGSDADERVFVGGATNILAQPEFRDVQKVLPLLTLLERGDGAQQLLPAPKEGLQVRIGQENSVPALQDLTVISKAYFVGNEPAGTIGILGPTRMNYARVSRILDYVSAALTQVMTNRHHSS